MASILLVDDNADIRFLARMVLERGGHTVFEVEGGMEALSFLDQSDPPDLVVLDVQMPVMTGWETLEAIRARDGAGHLPVVMCSVKTAPNVKVARELGCDGYIGKPFRVSELVDQVDTVLAAHNGAGAR